MDVYLATLTTRASQQSMAMSLRILGRLAGVEDPRAIPWATLSVEQVEMLRHRLIEHYGSFRSVNKALAALRGVVRQAWRMELMDSDRMTRLTDVKDVKGRRPPAGRDLSRDEVLRCLSVWDDSPKGLRNRGIITVLSLGLRRAEVTKVWTSDYQLEHLNVHGKGHALRSVPLPGVAREELALWIEARGRDAGPLFCHVRGTGVYPRRGLAPSTISYIVDRTRVMASLLHFTPHDFRRTLVGSLLTAGVDMPTIASITGHKSMDTVALYDRRRERRAKEAMEQVFKRRDP